MSEYTPMLRQYLEIKQQHPGCLLFFRLGDFYEMFMDDAEEAARLLEITLTGRDAGKAGRVPMCGVPYHAAEGYIAKLLVQGKKVAICEQVEDPAQAKGLVRREVTRVVTPGSVLDGSLLPPGQNNYLAAMLQEGRSFGLAVIELSTGEILLGEYSGRNLPARLIDDYLRLQPTETLLSPALAEDQAVQRLLQIAQTKSQSTIATEVFSLATAKQLYEQQGWEQPDDQVPTMGLRSLGAALDYLHQLRQQVLSHLRQPRNLHQPTVMLLDEATRRNLELIRSSRSQEVAGSLLSVLNRTVSSMGSRELVRWITEPLAERSAIQARLDAVEELASQNLLRDQVRSLLKGSYDLERLAGRVATGTANARDLLALGRTLQLLPQVVSSLEQCRSQLLFASREQIQQLPQLTDQLQRALQPEPPVSLREGGIFRTGYSAALDAINQAAEDGKVWLAELESRERERTGIRSLKVGYNKVFGYYLEVTKSNLSQVPADYVRKQTLVNAERFITEELKSKEDAILGAEERRKALEYELFTQLRQTVNEFVPAIQQNAAILARLDCLQSLAEAAVRERYCKPSLTEDGSLQIVAGRHPVVEKVVGRHQFVPNDLNMQPGELLVITGPNMGGKSTYMRQVALIVLMAQMGSFVPAESAAIGLVDRIFTRVGAADDLFSGQSTFMVEMAESRTAITEATADSLILFDELGRGTSTYDGMAIAEAIIEYVHQNIGAKTLFSTHYHELTSLSERLPRVRNICCQVAEQRGELVFLRQMSDGKADRSYGINVAKMAGLPGAVLQRARQILRRLEQRHPAEAALQLTLGDLLVDAATEEVAATRMERPSAGHSIVEALQALELDMLTPLAALNLLAKWQQELRKEEVALE
ncbi:MAG: DNA mismatch repair protein MutS [Bacillota bacterium]|jgi:DNA mismatch repair protein MutS